MRYGTEKYSFRVNSTTFKFDAESQNIIISDLNLGNGRKGPGLDSHIQVNTV